MSLNNRFLLVLLPFFSACTQPTPAQIEIKGGQNFTRDGNVYSKPSKTQSNYSNYNNNYVSVQPNTEKSARVESIGVSDLSPPSISDKNYAKSEDILPPIDKKQADNKITDKVIIDDKPKAVNPWTNKPRSANEEPAAKAKKEQDIASSDTNKKISVIEKTNKEDKSKKIIISANDTKQDDNKLDDNQAQETIAKDADSQSDTSKTSNKNALKWPVASKKITSSFGNKGAGKVNDGINISADVGDPVWASADGEVVYVSDDMRDFGNMVLIKHNGGKTTTYAHLGKVEVNKYDRVKQGDVIGYIGKSENDKPQQLFFSVHDGKEAVNPQKFLKN